MLSSEPPPPSARGVRATPGRMLAMRLETPRSADHAPLVLREQSIPDPGPGEVLVRVTTCGVCRTDLQIAEGDLAARALPLVPGHQIVGRVMLQGVGVVAPAVGARVGIAWLGGACGVCVRCVSGRENLCERARFTGWSRDGGFATHVLARADYTFPIPDAFDDLSAAPLLCGGVIGYRSLRVSGILPGQRLGLYGFGASALLALQVALHWKCRVFVCTRSDRERARALELGAEWAGGYDDKPSQPLDAAITFAPSGDVVIRALEAVDRGGVVAINAIHLDRIPEFSYDTLWWERSLRSVSNFTRSDARGFLTLAAEIPIRPTFDIFPLHEANTALACLSRGEINGAAVLAIP